MKQIKATESPLMTPEHPDWPLFCEGLDRALRLGGGCDHTHKHCRESLELMGFRSEHIEDSIRHFEERGGYCDCEVMLNCVAVAS